MHATLAGLGSSNSEVASCTCSASRFWRSWRHHPAAAQSIDDVIALKRASGTPAISPDGRRVAFAVRETNWDEQRLRDRDLDRRCRHGRQRPPAHQRRQVEPAAGLVARRHVGGVHLGPQRQAPALSPVDRGRRGRGADLGRRGRHRVRLVARRRAHRLHDDRPGHGGDEGARGEVRRVHAGGPRPSHGAAARVDWRQGHARR